MKAKKRLAPPSWWRGAGLPPCAPGRIWEAQLLRCSLRTLPFSTGIRDEDDQPGDTLDQVMIEAERCLLWGSPRPNTPTWLLRVHRLCGGNAHIPQIWRWEEGEVIRIPCLLPGMMGRESKNLGLPCGSKRKRTVHGWNTKLEFQSRKKLRLSLGCPSAPTPHSKHVEDLSLAPCTSSLSRNTG